MADIVQAVTRYVARRLVERERALADDAPFGRATALQDGRARAAPRPAARVPYLHLRRDRRRRRAGRAGAAQPAAPLRISRSRSFHRVRRCARSPCRRRIRCRARSFRSARRRVRRRWRRDYRRRRPRRSPARPRPTARRPPARACRRDRRSQLSIDMWSWPCSNSSAPCAASASLEQRGIEQTLVRLRLRSPAGGGSAARGTCRLACKRASSAASARELRVAERPGRHERRASARRSKGRSAPAARARADMESRRRRRRRSCRRPKPAPRSARPARHRCRDCPAQSSRRAPGRGLQAIGGRARIPPRQRDIGDVAGDRDVVGLAASSGQRPARRAPADRG